MPRITGKWEKVSHHIMSSLLQCNVTRGKRATYNANTIVMILIATEQEYRECISDVVDDLQGHLYKFERVGKRALGNEYRYIIIFTEQPEKASTVVLFDLEDLE